MHVSEKKCIYFFAFTDPVSIDSFNSRSRCSKRDARRNDKSKKRKSSVEDTPNGRHIISRWLYPSLIRNFSRIRSDRYKGNCCDVQIARGSFPTWKRSFRPWRRRAGALFKFKSLVSAARESRLQKGAPVESCYQWHKRIRNHRLLIATLYPQPRVVTSKSITS